jgi:hypothetical protein
MRLQEIRMTATKEKKEEAERQEVVDELEKQGKGVSAKSTTPKPSDKEKKEEAERQEVVDELENQDKKVSAKSTTPEPRSSG